MPPIPDLRRLHQFVVVAETLSVSRAAQRLNIAQPALSVSLKRLEGEVGSELFVREPRGMRLAVSGLAALDDARLALTHAERAMVSARAAGRGTGGRLRVGFVASATYGLLQRIVPPFHHAFPDVELALSEMMSSGMIARALREDMIDVGILRTPVIESIDAVLVELDPDALVAAMPATHPSAAGDALELIDLAAEPFVMYRQAEAPGLRSAAMLACQEVGFVPCIAQEAVQIATVLALVESGCGIGLVPSAARFLIGDRLRLQPFATPPSAARSGLSLAYPSDARPAARRFAQSASETLAA